VAGLRLLSNHGLALLCVARQPNSRLREIADRVGVTERAAHRIVCELVDGGYLVKHRVGNRNSYKLRPNVPIRDPMLEGHLLGELIALLGADSPVLPSGRGVRSGRIAA
jgi:hypothetical protein